MFKEGMNKKAQEGVTIGTLLLIVLGVVVLVVIILGATGGFNYIFGKVNLIPGQDLQAVVTSCEIAAQNGLKADYCSTFKQVTIDGTKQYVNCEDSRVSNNIDVDITKITCEPGAIVSFCNSNVKSTDWTKTLVNGKTCNDKVPLDQAKTSTK